MKKFEVYFWFSLVLANLIWFIATITYYDLNASPEHSHKIGLYIFFALFLAFDLFNVCYWLQKVIKYEIKNKL